MARRDYVIFFSNSGSEANEAAFKIAKQYHAQKERVHAQNLFPDIDRIMATQQQL